MTVKEKQLVANWPRTTLYWPAELRDQVQMALLKRKNEPKDVSPLVCVLLRLFLVDNRIQEAVDSDSLAAKAEAGRQSRTVGRSKRSSK